ncbi:hypothetical protein M0813_00719 [Anaeramoeba flamelloides]|uniref:Uncharacterized protein n=1 Tax=Anaeramoeba flamelloides TaxID=1746091 RepID=A0ABQ8XN96_9EUKA|nr:hypothetical protein M0813_00719 [Anaeramoeba flamelloides]
MDQQKIITTVTRKRVFSEADSGIYPLTTTTNLLTKTTSTNKKTRKQRRLCKRKESLTNDETQQEITKLESKFDEISEKHSQLTDRVQTLISEKEQMKKELLQLRSLIQRNEINQRKKILKQKKNNSNLLKFLILKGHILPSSQKGRKLVNNIMKHTLIQNEQRKKSNIIKKI